VNNVKAIVVDDEQLMLNSFKRVSGDLEDLEVLGYFQKPEDAIAFWDQEKFEIAFLDIQMPKMSGIECAKALRRKNPEILIVFISAFDNYLQTSNVIDADYYLMKPYKLENLRKVVKNMKLLCQRQNKKVYIQLFGRFLVTVDGEPLQLVGKTKEVLALIVAKHGKEISNEEIYSTIWETREYSNKKMKVYYNALRRLKDNLEKYNLSNLIISTARGQFANIEMFDCDYYSWLDNEEDSNSFNGEFLSEYSWGEPMLAEIEERELNRKNESLKEDFERLY
jgi:two-component system, LytTR family, response regulator